MDQPKIPTLKDAQKPQVKIKGMGAGLTLIDRLKQFKKKDLAFILAGLGTLFMAPLAEHFMMAPENGSSDMSAGFRGSGSGSNLFGGGSSPYENGNNSIAQGGAIGGGGDIITPLNVRDPSALVMGPGQAQQPPAGSAAPSAPPPTAPSKSEPDYRDALKGAATRAATEAVKRSPLPVPKVALGGSGLRGLGVAGGGTSASGGGGPIGPAAGGTGGGGGDRMLAKAGPNFRGAAGPRSPTGSGLDGTKRAGLNAGDQFNRTGSALGGLNSAASEQIPTGGSGSNGGGMGGAGRDDKGPGGSGAGGSKSVGESLAFIEAKERMMENMKYEFEMRKLKDPQRLMYEIRNESLKAMASELTKELTKATVGLLSGSAAAASSYTCGTYTGISINTPTCGKEPAGYCLVDLPTGKGLQVGNAAAIPCLLNNGKPTPPASTTEGGLSDLQAGLGSVCTKIGEIKSGGHGDYDTYLQTTVLTAAKNTELARNMLVSGGTATCGSAPVTGSSASKMLVDAKAKLVSALAGTAPATTTPAGPGDALSLITAAADKDAADAAKGPAQAVNEARALINQAKAKITEAQGYIGNLDAPVKVENSDESAYRDTVAESAKVQNGQQQAKALAASLNFSAVTLETAITSGLEPLIKDPTAQPTQPQGSNPATVPQVTDSSKLVGALPDQIKLNAARVKLEGEAKANPLAKSAITTPERVTDTEVKGEVIAEQKTTAEDLKALRDAIDTAATSAAAAALPTATEPQKTKATTDKTALEAALAKATTSVTTSQTKLKAVVTAAEPQIRGMDIRTTP